MMSNRTLFRETWGGSGKTRCVWREPIKKGEKGRVKR